MKISETLHFVWAGGAKPMDDSNLETIAEWVGKNPDFQIYFWVDSQTELANNQTYYRQYLENILAKKGINPIVLGRTIIFREISEFKKTQNDETNIYDYIRYEIDRLRPNFGASSDILRCAILYRYGGAYFDSDVEPGELSLTESGLFADTNDNTHRLYVTESQGTKAVGNDALICTQGHPLLIEILNLIKCNYRHDIYNSPIFGKVTSSFYSHADPESSTYLYDAPSYINALTPIKTGPNCVRDILTAFQKNSVKLPNVKVIKIDRLVQPCRDKGEKWKNANITTYKILAEAMESAIQSVQFELNNCNGMLRLDDHIHNIAASCHEQPNLEETYQAGDEFLTTLKQRNIEFQRVKTAQLSFLYPKNIDFYRERGISLEKACWFPLTDDQTYNVIGGRILGILSVLFSEQSKRYPAVRDSVAGIFETLIAYCDMKKTTIAQIMPQKRQQYYDALTELAQEQSFELQNIDLKNSFQLDNTFSKVTLNQNPKHRENLSLPTLNTLNDIANDRTPLLTDKNDEDKAKCYNCFPCFKS